jgi:hypothetical protein
MIEFFGGNAYRAIGDCPCIRADVRSANEICRHHCPVRGVPSSVREKVNQIARGVTPAYSLAGRRPAKPKNKLDQSLASIP